MVTSALRERERGRRGGRGIEKERECVCVCLCVFVCVRTRDYAYTRTHMHIHYVVSHSPLTHVVSGIRIAPALVLSGSPASPVASLERHTDAPVYKSAKDSRA